MVPTPPPCGLYGSPKFFVCMDHTLFMRSILVEVDNARDCGLTSTSHFWFEHHGRTELSWQL